MNTGDFRDDPEWQQARDDYVADERPGEHPDDVFPRRVKAAFRLWEIERSYRRRNENEQ